MTKQTKQSSEEFFKSQEKLPRVLARLVSKMLTDEEIQKVSGGENKPRCTTTNYPTADVICDI